MINKTCLILLNHRLLSEQEEELISVFHVNSILYLPKELFYFWNNIDPKGDLDFNSLNKITKWIKEEGVKKDYVIVQGEFGASFYITDFCIKNDYIPIYATSERVYTEKQEMDGSVLRNHIFRHKKFRIYQPWREL